MTNIRGKSQLGALLGTEAIPVETAALGDGWVTSAQIAALASANSASIPVYNVKTTYGATGNGSTNDSAACQNAINDCQSAGGGIVFFPTGTYNVPAGLLVTGSSVALMGAGRYATVISVPTNNATSPIELRGNSGNRFQVRYQFVLHMSVIMGSDLTGGTGHATSGTTPGIKIDYGNFQTVEEVDIFYFQKCLYLGPQANNPRTRNCYLITADSINPSYGVFIDNASGSTATEVFSPKMTYTNVASLSGSAKPGAYGFYAGNGGAFQDLLFAHCESNNVTYGYYLDGAGASGATLGADTHLDHCIADQDIYGYVIANSGTSIGSQVDLDCCYWSSAPSPQCGVYVTGSTGVHIRGFQAFAVNAGDGVQFANSSGYCTVTDGQFNLCANGVTSDNTCTKLGIHGNMFASNVTTPLSATLLATTGSKGRGNISSGTLNDFG